MSTAMRKSSTPAMENAGSVMPSASSTGFPAIPITRITTAPSAVPLPCLDREGPSGV